MAFWDSEIDIVEVEKNRSEKIVVKFCSRNDKKYVDIRVSRVDKEGEYHPTSNGVPIPLDQVETILNAIKEHIE